MKLVSKKSVFCAVLLYVFSFCGILPLAQAKAAEFSIRAFPIYTYFSNDLCKLGLGGTAAFDFSPATFRANDKLLFSVQGSYVNMIEDGINAENYIDYGIGAGYSFRLSDRFYMYPEFLGGIWTIIQNKKNNLPPARGFLY